MEIAFNIIGSVVSIYIIFYVINWAKMIKRKLDSIDEKLAGLDSRINK